MERKEKGDNFHISVSGKKKINLKQNQRALIY